MSEEWLEPQARDAAKEQEAARKERAFVAADRDRINRPVH